MQTTREGETMQATREGKATHNAIRVMSALAIATWLGAGCGKTEKTEKTEPLVPEASKPVQIEKLAPETPPAAPKPVEAEKWEPETVKPSEAQSDHGHSHGPGGHTH